MRRLMSEWVASSTASYCSQAPSAVVSATGPVGPSETALLTAVEVRTSGSSAAGGGEEAYAKRGVWVGVGEGGSGMEWELTSGAQQSGHRSITASC